MIPMPVVHGSQLSGFALGRDDKPRMIRVTETIAIDEREIEESFIRASGPGGQNVNKLATAVQLRFDVRRSPSLPNDVSVRLQRLAGSRLTNDGVLIITAQRFRTQERNRADALERLVELIRAGGRRAEKAPPDEAEQGGQARTARRQEAPLEHQEHAARQALARLE